MAGCGVGDIEVPARADAQIGFKTASPRPGDRVPAPRGSVTVAYPAEPASFLALASDDPAATDLLSLWGLPLFRVDPAGQLLPGLVAGWEVVADQPWTVALDLRDGRWSDGTPVRAADVVATIDALAAGPRAAELGPLVSAAAVRPRVVHLAFDRPYARWPFALSGVGVLPAAVLADGGLEAFEDDVPVSGGAYRLADHERGRELRFVASPGGPLGSPRTGEVRVLIVPSYETALGLLQDGAVDAVLGHLALNPVERALRVAGVDAAAPIGGTWVGLRWRGEGPLGSADEAPRRRAIARAIDVSQLVEGLLGPAGAAASSPVPGIPAPPRTSDAGGTAIGRPTIVLPRGHEALSFTGRAIQRDLEVAGGGLHLVSVPAPAFAREAATTRDGALAIFRSEPRPSLTPWVPDSATALAADASVPGTEASANGLAAVSEASLVTPFYRAGVAHVWREELTGFRPSAWPGLAFWSVGDWRLSAP